MTMASSAISVSTASTSSIGITLEHITRSYGGKAAVDGISLNVQPGEMLSLLGPSGCGKTTTLRCVAGFEIPDSGRVVIGDQDVTRVPAERRRVGMVFQNYALFPNLSVAGNIGFGLRVAGWNASKSEARIKELLEVVGLTGFERRSVLTLSGGQKQRVALARALAPDPRVLLLDEPLSALDAKIRAELRTELRRLQLDLGITTLLVTHDQEEAMSMSDRVVVMNHGRIEQLGTPRDLYATPATPFVAAFVGDMNFRDAQPQADGSFRISEATVRIPHLEPKPGRLGVRPEAVALEPAGEGRTQGSPLRGTVELVTYLGADQQVLVRIGPDVWVARVPNDQVFSRGQTVSLVIPDHAWLWMPK
jgi:putative spermidine/putrescine transport system ATP-binding protein